MWLKAQPYTNQMTLFNIIKKPFSASGSNGSIVQIKMDSNSKIVTNLKSIAQNIVPDVVGMSLKDAVYMLEKTRSPRTHKWNRSYSISICPSRLYSQKRSINHYTTELIKMKILKEILNNIAVNEILGNTNVSVTNICIDSRLASSGSVFVAIKGTQTDGHQYINTAITQGTKVIVCEDLPIIRNEDITYVKVKESSLTLGQISAAFYDFPSKDMIVIGVTGNEWKNYR